jgi:DHA2 family multidrug resistance protein
MTNAWWRFRPVACDKPDHSDTLDAGLLRIAGVCILASVMAILDTTVVSVAQRTFIVDFGSSQAIVGWTMTGNTLGLATVIPLAGWASDRFGTKRLFMGAVQWFTLGSLLCSTATTITALITFRVIQGLGGGMLMPVMFIVLAREAGPRRLGRLMGVLGCPDAAGSDVWAGAGRLVDRLLRLAMDFPHQSGAEGRRLVRCCIRA